MKIRIKFRKWGAMKFIGHLDIMRYFQKVMRRADIDICYTEGFSPHQVMSFAAPLGVGITSDGEYLDIEVHESMSSREALRKLNSAMVEGMEVTSYVKLPDTSKTAMSIVAAADYRLSFKEGYPSPFTAEEWQRTVSREFETKEHFLIVKKTKKGEREMDLKPLVYRFFAEEAEDGPVFFLRVSTGSTDNVKPEMVLAELFRRCDIEYRDEAIQIHRLEVYARGEDGTLTALSDMGEEIA